MRTPATGVKQYVGILLEGYAGEITDAQRKYLETANDSNERQLAIIDDMLNVAHLDQGKIRLNIQKVDLNALMQGVADELGAVFAPRGQELRMQVPSESVTLEIDAERMRMVIGNLIDNASKYSPSGRPVTVALEDNAKNVRVSIRDEGIGIAQKDLKKLFKKFSRVYNKESKHVSGTGLGLYWAQKIVDLHGGEISVDSKLGQGTTFTIKLPRA